MKKTITLLALGGLLLAGTITSRAVVFDIDLSPLGGTALNLGAPPTHYFGDHAVGLAAPNESAFIPSPATGNEIGAGIKFDSVTKALSFHVGYGAAFGFTSLVAPYTDAHLHAPGMVLFPAPNASAGVIKPLGGFHAPAGPPGTGSFFGTVFLTPVEEGMLFDNKIYWNIHSIAAPGGEIRGQLVVVAVPEPATAALLLLGAVAISVRRR